MRKYSAIILLMLLLWGAGGLPVTAMELPSPEKQVEVQLDLLDLEQLESFMAEIDRQVGDLLPRFSVKDIVSDLMTGKLEINLVSLLNSMVRYFFREVVGQSSLLGQLVILAVVCAVLQTMQTAFAQGTTAKLAYAVAYLVLITLALSSFTQAVNIGRDAVDQMISFIHALLPVMLTLMAAVGGVASTAMLHPIMLGALGVIGTVIKNVVFPLLYFAALLSIVSLLSENMRVSRLAGLFKEISVGILMLVITIFMSLLTAQGVAGTVADGVTLRSAKFVTSSLIPVAGKMLADASEAIIGTSLLLKNAVGLFGVLGLLMMALFPALKLLSLVLIYKLAAAIVQPFGEGTIGEALNNMGGTLTYVFAAVVGVGLMFFFAVSIMIGLGNMAVMLR